LVTMKITKWKTAILNYQVKISPALSKITS